MRKRRWLCPVRQTLRHAAAAPTRQEFELRKKKSQFGAPYYPLGLATACHRMGMPFRFEIARVRMRKCTFHRRFERITVPRTRNRSHGIIHAHDTSHRLPKLRACCCTPQAQQYPDWVSLRLAHFFEQDFDILARGSVEHSRRNRRTASQRSFHDRDAGLTCETRGVAAVVAALSSSTWRPVAVTYPGLWP